MIPVVYIAGPINAPTIHEMLDNCDRGIQLGLRLSRAGFAVICVHALAFDEIVETDGDAVGERLKQVLDQDLELIHRADAVVLVTSEYATSKGTNLEVEWATKHGKPVLTEAGAIEWKKGWTPVRRD